MKKTIKSILALGMALSIFTGCSTPSDTATTNNNSTEYTIGINQFAVHGSLDNCREGFLLGLAQEGIIEGENLTVLYENANADGAINSQISTNFVANKVDLICAIATPAAQSSFAIASPANIPIIYSAITDPIAAELANADGTPVGEITGTSDKLPVERQLEMIRLMLPEAKVIGIMYSTSETNSVSAIAEYQEKAADFGFEIVVSGVSTVADIPLAADSLLEKVDCLNNLTDNTVVSALPIILDKANAKNIPVFGSEVEQVKLGCIATVGLDYVDLGIQTGKIAAKVLKGESLASEINFEVIEEAAFYANSKAAENLGITIPEVLITSAKEVFDDIIVE
jgi:ABC-type uncharacterized transport system, periplasmic component